MFTSFMNAITSTKFQINQLTLSRFSGFGHESLAVPDEISNYRGLYEAD